MRANAFQLVEKRRFNADKLVNGCLDSYELISFIYFNLNNRVHNKCLF